MFSGSLVALVTPMRPTGELDIAAFEQLLEWHIAQGTQGLVVLGSTGEAASVTASERQLVVQTAVSRVNRRIPVIVGAGTNNTRTTIELASQAREWGADAVLLVCPYYLKPTQEGLYQHFCAIAQAVSLPQILYNVPGRTACDLLPATTARLAKVAPIIGIKDATGDVQRVEMLRQTCGANFILVSGDDATACDFILQGGNGVISVTGNVAPQLMRAMCDAALAGDRALAQQRDKPLQQLHHDLFIESNPIPVKWALSKMGKIQNGIRLPLTPLTTAAQVTVGLALQQVLGV